MRGLVIKNTGSWYTVKTDEGKVIESKVKGNFRLKGIRSTNPVAVGDRVAIATNQEGTAFITEIEDRKNYIVRKSPNLSKQSQILAANLDQTFLLVTVNHPQTSTTFIDRFLAGAEAYRVPVVLIFNKHDVLDDDELHYEQMMVNLYETIGYVCKEICATTGEGMEELMPLLKDKITLFSDAHDTGMHTTTFSEMLDVPGGGYLIDTPGIKGFGTFDIEPEELTSYFRDIFHFSKQCKFSNCTHTHEPGCAVRRAVEDHYIAESRYQSYLSMLEDKNENKYREAF